MKVMTSLSLQWKLIACFAVIALLFAATAIYQGNQTKRVERSMESQKAEMENQIEVAKVTQLLQQMNTLEIAVAKSSDLEAVDLFMNAQLQLFEAMESISFTHAESVERLQRLQTQAKAYTAGFDQLVATMNDGDMDPMEALERIDELHTHALAAIEEMLAQNDQLYAAAAGSADQAQSRSFELLDRTMSMSAYAAVFVFVFTLVIAYLLVRSFLVPIGRLQSALRKVAEGDLRHRINASSADELGRLSDQFDQMTTQMRDMLRQTQAVAASLATYAYAAEQSSSITANANEAIVKTIQEIAEGTGQQAAQTESSALLVQELNRDIHEITNSAETMLSTSNDANRNAQSGSAAVAELQKASESSRDSISQMYEALSKLAKMSAMISKVTDSITEVSNQTNVLALNASIEAARAGVHGRGFSVIAEEVRLLSVQTKESSVHIGVMVEELHAGMESFRQRMMDTRASLDEQNRRVAETQHAFAAIELSMRDIGEQIGHIHRKSDMTRARNARLADRIQSMAAIAEETAAGVQEVNATSLQQDGATRRIASQAVDINGLSQRLYLEISAFKIEDESVEESVAVAESSVLEECEKVA